MKQGALAASFRVDVARGVEAVVSDLHVALGQDVLHEASEELDAGDRLDGSILSREGHEVA